MFVCVCYWVCAFLCVCCLGVCISGYVYFAACVVWCVFVCMLFVYGLCVYVVDVCLCVCFVCVILCVCIFVCVCVWLWLLCMFSAHMYV